MNIKDELIKFYNRPTHTWQYQHELLKYWETIKNHQHHGTAYQDAVIQIKGTKKCVQM